MPEITPDIKTALDEFKPDIVHCQTLGKMAAYANRYAKRHGIPIVNTVHTKFRYCYRNALKSDLLAEILLRLVIRRANAANYVCSVSDSMVKELKTYGIRKPVSVIRNGNIAEDNASEKIKSSVFTMLYVGLVIDYKNIGFSLEVLKELKKDTPSFKFYIVGRGPHENRFKAMVKRFGLEDNVEFVGAVTDKEQLSKYYEKSDLFLFPSEFDSAGLVVCEAASAKTPSLLIEGSSAAEIFTDNDTAFMAEGAVDKFVEKIKYLMKNPDLIKRVGENAKSVFTGWDNTVNQYLEVYNSLLKTKKA